MTSTLKKLERPKVCPGTTEKIVTGCGNGYITINRNGSEEIIEVFMTLGKSGGCAQAQLEALTRSLTLGLKYGIPVEEYIREFRGIRCPSPGFEGKVEITSCSEAIARALSDAVGLEFKAAKDTRAQLEYLHRGVRGDGSPEQ